MSFWPRGSREAERVTARYFPVERYVEALRYKEETGGVMTRTWIRLSGVLWPHYEVRHIPPVDPATLPWHLTHEVRGDEGWAS